LRSRGFKWYDRIGELMIYPVTKKDLEFVPTGKFEVVFSTDPVNLHLGDYLVTGHPNATDVYRTPASHLSIYSDAGAVSGDVALEEEEEADDDDSFEGGVVADIIFSAKDAELAMAMGFSVADRKALCEQLRQTGVVTRAVVKRPAAFFVKVAKTKIAHETGKVFIYPDFMHLEEMSKALGGTLTISGFQSVQTTFVKYTKVGTLKTRIRVKPKIGYYVANDGTVGRLCMALGKSGKKREFIFMTTHEAAEEALWCARLGHKGHDFKTRDMWVLDGHPKGGFFINDGGKFLECDEEKLRERRTWSFHGEKISDQRLLPWAAASLQDQFRKAKQAKRALKAMSSKSGEKPVVAPWAKKNS